MAGQFRRWLGARRRAAAVVTVVAAGAVGAVNVAAQDGGDTPLDPSWLSNTLTRATAQGEVKNNTVEGAVERRDAAIKAWKAANAKHRAGKAKRTIALAKPE